MVTDGHSCWWFWRQCLLMVDVYCWLANRFAMVEIGDGSCWGINHLAVKQFAFWSSFKAGQRFLNSTRTGNHRHTYTYIICTHLHLHIYVRVCQCMCVPMYVCAFYECCNLTSLLHKTKQQAVRFRWDWDLQGFVTGLSAKTNVEFLKTGVSTASGTTFLGCRWHVLFRNASTRSYSSQSFVFEDRFGWFSYLKTK